nr:MAG TPA: hypothetical protein [Caudoviricetes sp.]
MVYNKYIRRWKVSRKKKKRTTEEILITLSIILAILEIVKVIIELSQLFF